MSYDTSRRQSRRNYSFTDHGGSNAGQQSGNYIVKGGAIDIWGLAFKDGFTTIRILPNRDPDNPSAWDPYRLSTERLGFGDWIRRYDAMKSCGEPGVTFLTRNPADATAPDPQMLPGHILYTAISNAIKQKQERTGWASLLQGGFGRGAQLSKPTEVFLVQCFIFHHGSREYTPPKGYSDEDRPILLVLSRSAGMALLDELAKIKPDAQADSRDWENMYVNGDPIDINAGRFVTFYNLSLGDPRVQAQAQANPSQPVAWDANATRSGGTMEAKGYGCFLEPTYRGMSARMTDYQHVVAEKVKPWEDILYFPSVEEQAKLLADKFPADAIAYAFRDHPEWVPESVQRAAVAAHTVQTGWSPQGAWGGANNTWGAPASAMPPVQHTPPPLASGPQFGAPAPASVPAFGGPPVGAPAFGAPAPAPVPAFDPAGPAGDAGPTGPETPPPAPVAPPNVGGWGSPAATVPFDTGAAAAAPTAAPAPAPPAMGTAPSFAPPASMPPVAVPAGMPPVTAPATQAAAGDMAWNAPVDSATTAVPASAPPVAATAMPGIPFGGVPAAAPAPTVAPAAAPPTGFGQPANGFAPPPGGSRAAAALAAAQAAAGNQQPQ